LGLPLVDALLAPHRSYLKLLKPLLSYPQSSNTTQPLAIKALAHLTGGGFIENIPRVLPGEVNAIIRVDSWLVPPLFMLLQQRGKIAVEEMYRVFNMGIGMVIVAAPEQAAGLQAAIGEETFRIGEIVPGTGKVVLQ
jgi:phosphoribosylformylglycinamidine cyclo-ligase